MTNREDEFSERPELIKKRARSVMAENVWRLLWFITAAVVMALIAYDTLVGITTRQHLLDCVEPQGTCAKAAQEKTGNVVSDINTIITLAAYCADKPGVQTETQIKRCIQKGLEDDHG